MTVSKIVEMLKQEWDFSIRWTNERFTIMVWKPGWVTDDLYRSVACPVGIGSTVEKAYDDLQENIPRHYARALKHIVWGEFQPGVPCDHPGCFSHLTHPCEKCGRIGGKVIDET